MPVHEAMEFEVRPGVGQNLSYIEIESFELDSFDPRELIVNLKFKTPLDISMGDTADYVVVNIKNVSAFVS